MGSLLHILGMGNLHTYKAALTLKTMKETIVEEWDRVDIPPPPELSPVTVSAKETALLVLDIQDQNCTEERRPRCVQTLSTIKTLLSKARENNMTVVYSLTRAAEEKDIRKEVKPQKGELVVKSGVDKFFQTDLEAILKERTIKTVIIVGTSAHGAVLHTATGAAARGLTVVVPVDGMSAGEPYAEQYTAWHIVNAPGTRRSSVVTRAELIEIGP